VTVCMYSTGYTASKPPTILANAQIKTLREPKHCQQQETRRSPPVQHEMPACTNEHNGRDRRYHRIAVRFYERFS
jgi:hypothetical protein